MQYISHFVMLCKTEQEINFASDVVNKFPFKIVARQKGIQEEHLSIFSNLRLKNSRKILILSLHYSLKKLKT